MQEWKDLFDIIHPLAPDFAANLTKWDLPVAQLIALAGDNILVEDDHAASVSGGRSDNAFPASRIASAIASRGMLPWHSRRMVSQSRPSATISNTSETNSRVPRKVKLPWQILGSATMYSPNSIRSIGLLSCPTFRCTLKAG